MKKLIIGTFTLGLLASCGNNSSQEIVDSLTENDASSTTNGDTGVPQSKSMTDNLKNYKGYPVVFYNVENLFDTENDPRKKDDDFTPDGYKHWDEKRYEAKLEKLADAITLSDKKNPIFIGLAEVENMKTLRDLSNSGRLSETKYKVAHFESSDMRGIDVGLLYDLDRFRLMKKKKFKIDFDWNSNMTTRDILYVYGELMNEKEVHIFVNHWSSRREGTAETEKKRTTAAAVLRKEVDAILSNDPDANILIMGDFNDYPTDKSVQDVLRAKEATNLSDGDLVNLLWEEQEDGEGTINYNREWDVFDQMIVSQGFYKNKTGLGIEKNNAFIIRDDRLIFTYPDGGQKPSATYGGPKYYGGYSDHLPVYLILK